MGMFNYDEAFSRNIGWVSEAEQGLLRQKRVAIAGLGGVGGSHVLTLARLGIGAFHLADFDRFDLVNVNRQAGAMGSTLGRPKVEVLQQMALDINPELDLQLFPEGVQASNLEAFLHGIDLYVDSLDFFAFEARRQLFAACARLGIPAITAAPLGMGTAFLTFLPGGMSFEQYFQLDGQDEFEQGLRFLLGLAPARLQMRYLVDPSRVDLAAHKGPSTVIACQLCAGVAAAQALKILLGRGDVVAAPHGLHFDAYTNTLARTWLPGGSRNPVQQVKLALARRLLRGRQAIPASTASAESASPAMQVLDLARWAPSGDNAQSWRFAVHSAQRFTLYGYDTRQQVVYDFDGRPSRIALGGLIENIHLAAGRIGYQAEVSRRPAGQDAPCQVLEVNLVEAAHCLPDPLAEQIITRSVQRRPLSTRRLSAAEKTALQAAVGPDFRVIWLEGARLRWAMARLLSANAKIRLTMPEAYPVHRDMVAWQARFSTDRLPDQAIGMDPLGLRLMRWVLQSWPRVQFFNRYLAGTWLPRLQLDLLPGWACGAHFLLVADQGPANVDDELAAGRALQRFWLTATQLGLQLQPQMTPLVFSWYVAANRRFSQQQEVWQAAQQLQQRLQALVGERTLQTAVAMGRIGAGKPAQARSLRRPLQALLVSSAGCSQLVEAQ